MIQSQNLTSDVLRPTMSVATAFWAVCLLLVAVDATLGDNFVTGILFFVSVPVLVGSLLWANKALLVMLRRGLVAAVALGVYVLGCATVILFIGLFAAANLKSLIIGT